MTAGGYQIEYKSTYEWVSQFMTEANTGVYGYTSTELKLVSSTIDNNVVKECWEYIYYFDNSYEIWETKIWFDSQYDNSRVPKSAIYHLRSDGTARYLPNE